MNKAGWVLLALVVLGAAARADEATELDVQTALARSQAAIGRQISDYSFRDTSGRLVRLSDFAGQPLIVNLVYTGCTSSCPLIIQRLHPAIKAGQETLGTNAFKVLTIGFDAPADSPARMRAYAREQGADLPSWIFLSADRATIKALTDELGFEITPSPQGFDHLAQTTILDGERRVYRQVYGSDFEVPAIVEPLQDLVWGRQSDWTSVEGLINRVRLFCTLYDPRTESYRFDYSIIIGAVIGVLSLSGVGMILLREWRRMQRPQAGI